MTLTAEEVIRLNKEYTLFEWNMQGGFTPMPIDHAKGVYFWTTDGKRYLDFNSQLMSVNIGHGDERVIRAYLRLATAPPPPAGSTRRCRRP